MSPGRGRPPKYVEDPITKKPVVGLSEHKTNGFFYNTHWKTEKVKMHNFGSDKNAAIFAFRQWEQKRGSPTPRDPSLGMGQKVPLNSWKRSRKCAAAGT